MSCNNKKRKVLRKIVCNRVCKIMDRLENQNIVDPSESNLSVAGVVLNELSEKQTLIQDSYVDDPLDLNLSTTGVMLNKETEKLPLVQDSNVDDPPDLNLSSSGFVLNEDSENQTLMKDSNIDDLRELYWPATEFVIDAVVVEKQTVLKNPHIDDQPSTSGYSTASRSKLSKQQLVDYSDDSDRDPNYIPSEESSDDNTVNTNNISFHYNGVNREVTRQRDNSDEVNSISQHEINDNIHQPTKRVRRSETWQVTKRSAATRAGLEHKSKSGKKIEAKSLKPGCAPCRKNCTLKIHEEVRQQIFSAYWNAQKTWDLKRQFVRSHITSKLTERHRPKDNSRYQQRKQTILYNFDIKTGERLEKIEVCKTFFLNTLGISETVVHNALKKDVSGGFVAMDMRGRHVPPNKLPDDVLNRIRLHINSFPCYESHYSRQKSSKKYLGPELNKEKMYKLYLAKCEEDKLHKQQIAKLWAYKKILNSEFNLGFKTPSADTCDSCDKFVLQLKEAAGDVEKSTIQEKYSSHLQDADLRYKLKKSDKENSINTPAKTKVVMLDLQKCLPTPYLTNNQSFYCLKLWTLNLTIYDATTKKSYCMVWDESEAGRGGHEIASALLKWAEIVLANSTVEHLIIWSDNCPSQNRNVMMMMSYLWLTKTCPNLQTVEHKFLLRGHTHMEADHIHAVIERSLKRQPTMEICTPWDWEQLIRSTGATVIRMRLPDFKNFEALYNCPQSPFLSKKQNTEKQPFLISTVVNFQVQAAALGTIFYKQSFRESFKALNVARSVRNAPQLPELLPVQRKNLKGVTKKKYDYLIKLLQWVPIQFHDFYKNIPICQKNVDDDE